MSTTVKYKGTTIATISNTTKTLQTQGKYCEDNIEITDSGGGGGANLTHGSKSVTPSETAYSGTEYPPTGYDGFDQFTVSVGAISSTYVGSGVPRQAAQTIHPSTSDQTISASQYLTGAQTVKGVVLTNLLASVIKKDEVVKIGDSTDDDCVASVTGTYEGGSTGKKYKTGTYKPAATYKTTANRAICTINDIGFTPNHFILAIKDRTSQSGVQGTVLRSSFDNFSSNEGVLRVTTSYSNTSNSQGSTSAFTSWATQTNNQLYLSSGTIYFRTTSSYILTKDAEYNWYAYE